MKNYTLFTIATIFMTVFVILYCKTERISTLVGETKWLDYLILSVIFNIFIFIIVLIKKFLDN